MIHRPDLYHAGVAQLTPLLATRTEETVLVIGHNPGIEEMLLYFSGQDRQITTGNAALLTTAARRWVHRERQRWRARTAARGTSTTRAAATYSAPLGP